MHWLGVAGMPQSIPDYLDACHVFNENASWGAEISAFSLVIFLRLVTVGEESDACAKHFVIKFPNSIPIPDSQCGGITCIIIWQGNPVHAVKIVVTKNCVEGPEERTAIIKQHGSNPQRFINSNNKSTIPHSIDA